MCCLHRPIHYVALIHKPVVLTKESNVSFLKQVKLNDTVRAEAQAVEITNKYFKIKVNSYVKDTLVFRVHSKCIIQVDEQNG